MRKLRTLSGQTLAIASSLLLISACGGGGGGDDPALTAGGGTSQSTSSTTTTQAGSTTTTQAGATSTSATATTTSTTTSSTIPAPHANAAATLTVQHTGFCMGVTEVANNSNVRQLACIPKDTAQSWQIAATAIAGEYTIKSNQSNLCLRVNEAAPDLSPEAPTTPYAVQNTCDGSANTLWKFEPSATAGQFNIISKLSGLCLDVIASDVTPGKELIQYTCNIVPNQANQRWVVTPIAP